MRSLYRRYRRLNDWFRDHPIADDILMAVSCGVGVAIAGVFVSGYQFTTAVAVGLLTILVGVVLRIGVYRRRRLARVATRLYDRLRKKS